MTRAQPCATYRPPNVTGGRCVDCGGTPADHPSPPTLDAPSAPASWDERHRREARILLRRLSLSAEIAGDERAAYVWCVRAEDSIRSQGRLCELLGGPGLPYLDAAEIQRKVRGVRDLAEGRAVREASERFHVYKVHPADTYPRLSMADASAQADYLRTHGWPWARAVRVKVTRIRHAPR